MIDIKFKKLRENAIIPRRGDEFAGGWDVFASEIEQKAPNYVIVKLGFALEFPTDYKLMLVPRSSLTKTNWYLPNSPGLGDPSYRGEYQMRFRCVPIIMNRSLTYDEFPFKIGDRVGQIFLSGITEIDFIQTDILSESTRGEGGFGSTGQ